LKSKVIVRGSDHGRDARFTAGGRWGLQKKECLFLTNEAVMLLKRKDRENERSRTKPIFADGKPLPAGSLDCSSKVSGFLWTNTKCRKVRDQVCATHCALHHLFKAAAHARKSPGRRQIFCPIIRFTTLISATIVSDVHYWARNGHASASLLSTGMLGGAEDFRKIPPA